MVLFSAGLASTTDFFIARIVLAAWTTGETVTSIVFTVRDTLVCLNDEAVSLFVTCFLTSVSWGTIFTPAGSDLRVIGAELLSAASLDALLLDTLVLDNWLEISDTGVASETFDCLFLADTATGDKNLTFFEAIAGGSFGVANSSVIPSYSMDTDFSTFGVLKILLTPCNAVSCDTVRFTFGNWNSLCIPS